VVHDRQAVLGGGAPDRLEIGVVGRDVLAERRLDGNRPGRIAPLADFLDRRGDLARGALIRPFSRFGNRLQKSAM
jgi:hypothetical protein